MFASLRFFAASLVLGNNVVVLHSFRISSNSTVELSGEIETQRLGKDRCCCKPKSAPGRSDVTQEYCQSKNYLWLARHPQKGGEYCCKVQKNVLWCDGYGKDKYTEENMWICDSGRTEKMTCEQMKQSLGIENTCALSECKTWCQAECRKFDVQTACMRPECKNLQVKLRSGARPFLNCKAYQKGFKPCCGSTDYWGGKTAYNSYSQCTQQFPSANCLPLTGRPQFTCVPVGQTCSGGAQMARRTHPNRPQGASLHAARGGKLCCGTQAVHRYSSTTKCFVESKRLVCDTEPTCVPEAQQCA